MHVTYHPHLTDDMGEVSLTLAPQTDRTHVHAVLCGAGHQQYSYVCLQVGSIVLSVNYNPGHLKHNTNTSCQVGIAKVSLCLY